MEVPLCLCNDFDSKVLHIICSIENPQQLVEMEHLIGLCMQPNLISEINSPDTAQDCQLNYFA